MAIDRMKAPTTRKTLERERVKTLKMNERGKKCVRGGKSKTKQKTIKHQIHHNKCLLNGIGQCFDCVYDK